MKKYRVHAHKINEMDNPRSRANYILYTRRFWHVYRVYKDWVEENAFEGHIEYNISKKLNGRWFSARLHTGNMGSETPWDGHLCILWFNFYWGHNAFRKLANLISECSGYRYDSRDWTLRVFNETLWWEVGNHSDMCDKHRPKKRRRTFREGNINLNPATWIWGRKQYSYETMDSFATMIKLPEGTYPAIIDLQRQSYGRVRVSRDKHQKSMVLQVDSPTGIPTHVDHSGGYKGDRTYGFGVTADFHYTERENWQIDAEAAVASWVLNERARTGFRKPDPVGRD